MAERLSSSTNGIEDPGGDPRLHGLVREDCPAPAPIPPLLRRGRRSILFGIASLILLLCQIPLSAAPAPDEKRYKEYEVKAACIYNFLKFVEWPRPEDDKDPPPLTLGVFGKDVHRVIEKVLKNRTVRKGKVRVIRLTDKDLKDYKAVFGCDAVFIPDSQKMDYKKFTARISRKNILTIGESKEFFEGNGTINFVLVDKKIRFEINLAGVRNNKLKISSKILRIAKRVVRDKDEQKK